jgi:peptide/nickel transport system ATP-binding protein
MPGGAPGQRLRAIEGSVPLLGALPPGCAFNPRCPDRFEPCTTAPPPDYAVGPSQTAKCYLHDPQLAVQNRQSAIRPSGASGRNEPVEGRHPQSEMPNPDAAR